MTTSQAVDEKHAHLLSRFNIQMCQYCRKFFIITYERNEKGEAVETGYELDIHVTSSGVVRPQTVDRGTIEAPSPLHPRRENASQELSCF